MKILVFGCSHRKGSYNKKLAETFSQIGIEKIKAVEWSYIDFSTFEIPVFNDDMDAPGSILQFAELVKAADGLVVASPEYNGSIAAPLKNWIDWFSTLNPMPLKSKPVLLLAATPGALAALRGLWHTQVPFDALGSYVYPEFFGFGSADKQWDADGKLIDPKMTAKIETLLTKFVQYAQKLKG